MPELGRSQEGQGSFGTFQQRKLAVPRPPAAAQLAICQGRVRTTLKGSNPWPGAGAEGAVQKHQQSCLHLATRITLPEEISAVREPRELSA